MGFNVDDAVLVTAKILSRDPETNEAVHLNLSNEPGIVKKVDESVSDNHYYVQTQHGTHYLSEQKLSAV